jgi:arsenite-transporting ATPase
VKGAKAAAASRRAKKHARPTPCEPALPASRYLFFGGKGGTGKTTTAAATALYLLDRARPGERILIFSTDPAHSLSDSFGVPVGGRPREVARSRNDARLIAYEMDASIALEKFKTEHRATLAEIADRGTLLDKSDINELLSLSLPGVDEVMALFELSEFDREGGYARVVVDTAPSGHTSRLLRLPEVFSRMVAALDRMADKHRYIVAQFARGVAARARRDEVDVFLDDLAERIGRVQAMLTDAERTSFTLVAIPEAMSVEETKRYFALLQEARVPVTDLVVNRVEEKHDVCAYCRARARGQQPSLKALAREFKSLGLHHVPLLPAEVRGPVALRNFARLVWEERKAVGSRQQAVGSQDKLLSLPTACCFSLPAVRVLLFGGKGGVGKTTAAAATALALAEREAGARVLVFSTDPAHSLSDSFGEPIGPFKQNVAGLSNLDAMEIDPAARFEELKARYRAWTDELFAQLAGGSRWEIQFDREAMRELVALAPPGIDEIAALSAVSDLLDEDRYTTIVLDTAPTGHLVRFLELPQVALSWVRTFIKLLLKYQNVVRATGVAEELVALSKSVKRVMALLTNPETCEFVGVARPERMSLEETARLTPALKRLKVPVRRLLINGVVPEEAARGCEFCAARLRHQCEVIEDFRGRFKNEIELFVAAEQPHEVRGPAPLREHFEGWRSLKNKK